MSEIEVCQDVFNKFDEDSNNSLDGFEFVSLCARVGMSASAVELRRIFNTINTSQSGEITSEEFQQFWLSGVDSEDQDSLVNLFRSRLQSHFVSPQAAAKFRNDFAKEVEGKNVSFLPYGPVESVKMGVNIKGDFSEEEANSIFAGLPEEIQLYSITRVYSTNPQFLEKALKGLVEQTRNSTTLRITYDQVVGNGFDIKMFKAFESEQQKEIFDVLFAAAGKEPFNIGFMFPWTSTELGALRLKAPELLNFEISFPRAFFKGEEVKSIYPALKEFLREMITKDPIEEEAAGYQELLSGQAVGSVDFTNMFDEVFDCLKDHPNSRLASEFPLISKEGEFNDLQTVMNCAVADLSSSKRSLRNSEQISVNFADGGLNVLDILLQKYFERDSYEVDFMHLRARNGHGVKTTFFNVSHIQGLSAAYNIARLGVASYIEARRAYTAKRDEENKPKPKNSDRVVYDDYQE